MATTDYTWLAGRLEELGYDDPKIIRAVEELCYTLDAQDVSKEEGHTISNLFDSVIQDRIFLNDSPEESAWVPFNLGVTTVGETVRVKDDAYSADAGLKHNGKVGTIVAVRGGRIRVQYLGRDDGVGHAHHPDALQVLDKKSASR